MNKCIRTRRGGFSLLEVVIVVAIIAILAAIGIPRMSRGSKGANDSALSGDLAVLRNAIEIYATEHGGAFPKATDIVSQLTLYTDVAGTTSATRTATAIYGPYIRTIPPLPVGSNKGKTGISANAADPGTGWVYVEASGTITANTTTETDDAGKTYNTY